MRYAEREFLKLLEARAVEQQMWHGGWGGFTPLIRMMSAWWGIHPWRVFVPISVFVVAGMAYVMRGWLLILVGWLQGGW